MKLRVTVAYNVTYQVEYHSANEGGMDWETFGKPQEDLAQAIGILEIAQTTRPEDPWAITVNVKKEVISA